MEETHRDVRWWERVWGWLVKQWVGDDDHLPWREKVPLYVTFVPSSFCVYLWFYTTISGKLVAITGDAASGAIAGCVALAAGIAFDQVTVATTLGRRERGDNWWSGATLFVAWLSSSMVIYDLFSSSPIAFAQWGVMPVPTVDWRALLHATYATVGFLYAQHLIQPRTKHVVKHNASVEKTQAKTQNAKAGMVTVEHAQLPMIEETQAKTQNAIAQIPENANAIVLEPTLYTAFCAIEDRPCKPAEVVAHIAQAMNLRSANSGRKYRDMLIDCGALVKDADGFVRRTARAEVVQGGTE